MTRWQISSTDANASFAGQRRPQWGNRDLQLDQQDGGQLDGDGLGCDAGRHHRQHQHFLHGQSGCIYEAAIAGAGRDRRPGHRDRQDAARRQRRTRIRPFNVTANAVDANWNVVPTVGDTVAITASDPNATLPANAALSGGHWNFQRETQHGGQLDGDGHGRDRREQGGQYEFGDPGQSGGLCRSCRSCCRGRRRRPGPRRARRARRRRRPRARVTP